MGNDHRIALEEAFAACLPLTSARECRLMIIAHFNEMIALTTELETIPRPRAMKIRTSFEDRLDQFLLACGRANVGEFIGVFGGSGALDLLEAHATALSLADKDLQSGLDRAGFRSATEELIGFMHRSDYPALARDAMILQLSAISRLSAECSYLGDADIRRRVKVIFADFCDEFSVLEKRDRTMFDHIKEWARKAGPLGFQTIGPIADVSEVIHLIGPPG